MRNFIIALIEVLGKLIGIIAIIIVVAYIGVSVEKASDDKIYNNGECYYCEHGHYELINVQRGKQGRMYYFYKCNNCNIIIELNSNMELQAL